MSVTMRDAGPQKRAVTHDVTNTARAQLIHEIAASFRLGASAFVPCLEGRMNSAGDAGRVPRSAVTGVSELTCALLLAITRLISFPMTTSDRQAV